MTCNWPRRRCVFTAITGQPVPEGAIYCASSKRGRVVTIPAEFRLAVANTAQAVRDL